MAIDLVAACDCFQLRLFGPMLLFGLRAAEPCCLFGEYFDGNWLRVPNNVDLQYWTKGRRDKRFPLIDELRPLWDELRRGRPQGLLYERCGLLEGREQAPLRDASLAEIVAEYRRRCAARGGSTAADRQRLRDAVLLGCFVECRDEAAFAALVRRHSPLVWGVCRRVLGDHHDAEDAFQATFLVLARKAASIASSKLLANWLHGVARNTARKARAKAARRRARERLVACVPDLPAAEESHQPDLRPLLDEEVGRLPGKYRVVILLCDLEGKTRREAAGQLGLPEGTVAGRLARARAMLARRLSRRGVVLSGGALAAALSGEVASASLVSSTLKAATLFADGRAGTRVAALAEGVLKAMLWTRIKAAAAAVLVVALLGVGGGVLAWQGQASRQPARQLARAAAPGGKDEDLKKTLLELDELWWKGDVETLRKLAADDLITVSGVGRYDKESLLAASRIRHPADWTRREVEVCRVSRDVAVVTYLYDCKIVLGDGTLVQKCRDRRLSMTWAKRKDGWVVVFSQETILPGGE